MDSDLDPQLPIIIAFDANSNFNCMVCGQSHDQKLYVLKSFFVKYDRKLPELVDDFCHYYRFHKTRKVIFYFDATFKGTVTGVHANELYVIIEHAFKSHQWAVQRRFIGRPMNHIEKNLLINQMLQGKRQNRILINRDNNEDLLISLYNAAVVNGKKDKSGEKEVETDQNKLESRTDFSDAFDTLCIGTELFPTYQGRALTPNAYGK